MTVKRLKKDFKRSKWKTRSIIKRWRYKSEKMLAFVWINKKLRPVERKKRKGLHKRRKNI